MTFWPPGRTANSPAGRREPRPPGPCRLSSPRPRTRSRFAPAGPVARYGVSHLPSLAEESPMSQQLTDLLRTVEVTAPQEAAGLQVFGLRWAIPDGPLYQTLD